MNYKDLLKNIWSSVYNPKFDAVTAINKFFHKDYEQCINGISMNQAEYLHHVLKERENIVLDAIEYKHTLEKDNEFFALYNFKAKNKNNESIAGEVVAYFRFENQQLIKMHGQLRLMEGILVNFDM